MKIKLFVTALEYSANLHLKNFLKELENLKINFELHGIFDEKIIEAKSDINPSVFRVMGFLGVIKLIPLFLKTKKTLAQIAATCDIAIFMDSSSFNIPLIKKIKKQNNKNPKIVYYILPQVWAWKRYRAKVLSEICDELWGILPFEGRFYPQNANIKYVGHPLLDTLSFSYTTPQNTNKIAFMPGSRIAEIKALFPIFRELARILNKNNKESLLIIPHTFKDKNLAEIYGDTSDFSLEFDTQIALKKSEFAFVCSGTATLESTLFGIPTILAYKAKALDYYIAKALVKLRFIGLANIFLEFKSGRILKEAPIHPEFLQNNISVENLKNAYLNYDYDKFFTQKKELLKYLDHGSTKIVAKNLEKLIKNLQK
ncbi:MAG: lipid-A-disaccharide synthase [Helicobacter sp.]|nr:lipid-A-disaccharide synthase [Helicobacter sp.]